MTTSLEKFEAFVSQFVYKKDSEPTTVLARQGIRRPPLGKSEGERMIQKILERDIGVQYGSGYQMEYVFDDMSRKLRFDFLVRDQKKTILIEFDGDQHYSGSRFHRTRNEWLEAIERDELKNEYCRQKGLSLLRIPQAFCKDERRMRETIIGFFERVRNAERNVIDIDLYFQLKAGKLSKK